MNVLHTECSLKWGGQEYRTCIEVDWLNKHGHRAWIACDPASELYRRSSRLGLPALPIKMRRPYNIKSILQLVRFCRQSRVEVIHNHGSRDSWLCVPLYLAGYPTVRSRHVTVPVKPTFSRSFGYRFCCSRVLATAAVIAEMLAKGNKVPRQKIDVVGEGVDLDEYNPAVDGSNFRREFGIDAAAPLLGIIGMLQADKGHRYFLDAAFDILRTHPQARFVIIGESTGNRQVEDELRARIVAGQETERIVMTGYRWDIPEAIAAMDIVVVASIAVEAQSRVVPQAFASKKAVIASDIGGIPELVQHGHNGLLVPSGDARSLAAAMRRLIDNTALRRRLAASGYEKACAELSLERMMELTLACYRKAIAS